MSSMQASMSFLHLFGIVDYAGKGEGLLKGIQATFWVKKFTLSRGDKNSITDSDGSTFKNEAELKDFLLNEVK